MSMAVSHAATVKKLMNTTGFLFGGKKTPPPKKTYKTNKNTNTNPGEKKKRQSWPSQKSSRKVDKLSSHPTKNGNYGVREQLKTFEKNNKTVTWRTTSPQSYPALPSPIQHRSFSAFAAKLQWVPENHSFASSSLCCFFVFPFPSQSDFGKQNPTQTKHQKNLKPRLKLSGNGWKGMVPHHAFRFKYRVNKMGTKKSPKKRSQKHVENILG